MLRRTISILFLNISICLLAMSQNVVIEVDGDDLFYSESGCADCNGDPDPRFRMRVWVNGTNYDWNVDDDEECGWTGNTNFSWVNPTTVPATAPLAMQVNGYESDGFISGGDDNNCGGYGTYSPFAVVNDYLQCQWNYFTTQRNCGSGTYAVYWSYYYYELPSGYNKIWVGMHDNDWHNSANWTECSVPTISQSVYIPNATFDPIIYSPNVANCKNITIATDAGAVLEVQTGATLNIAD